MNYAADLRKFMLVALIIWIIETVTFGIGTVCFSKFCTFIRSNPFIAIVLFLCGFFCFVMFSLSIFFVGRVFYEAFSEGFNGVNRDETK